MTDFSVSEFQVGPRIWRIEASPSSHVRITTFPFAVTETSDRIPMHEKPPAHRQFQATTVRPHPACAALIAAIHSSIGLTYAGVCFLKFR
jgi:hypothetical protein